MIGLAVLFTALGAALAVPAPRRLPPVAAAPAGGVTHSRRRPLGRTGWVGVVLVVPLVWWLAGGRAGVLTGVAVLAGGAVLLVLRGRRRERALLRRRAEVARAADLLAAELSLGKVPSAALGVAAEDVAVLAPAAAAARIGAEVPQVWQRQAAEPGYADLAALARAWQVAGRTGAPLGPSLLRVADGLRVEEELRRTVAGELAAPRMTGVVLALLPVAGVALGYLIGGDPLSFLTGTPWGQVCLLGGTLLAAAGLLWTERLGALGAG
ncbi:type II secretion system F family protein [Enemella evansiae]|uniref:type II secretion system F family protein n=3 Tax=Enemella evansiae TaxID=2016499 RepID=UPI00105E77E7|nr:type II secretion system F family protein [Enemella evansiae]TDO94608.1 tight adherence protein B [Enemella evansiae]